MRFSLFMLFIVAAPLSSASALESKKPISIENTVANSSLPKDKVEQSKLTETQAPKPFQLVMPPKLNLGLCDGSE